MSVTQALLGAVTANYRMRIKGRTSRSTLADAHQSRHLGEAHLRVLRDAQQHVRMVGEERPVRHRGRCGSATRHEMSVMQIPPKDAKLDKIPNTCIMMQVLPNRH